MDPELAGGAAGIQAAAEDRCALSHSDESETASDRRSPIGGYGVGDGQLNFFYAEGEGNPGAACPMSGCVGEPFLKDPVRSLVCRSAERLWHAGGGYRCVKSRRRMVPDQSGERCQPVRSRYVLIGRIVAEGGDDLIDLIGRPPRQFLDRLERKQ